jgi:hypothetical protein
MSVFEFVRVGTIIPEYVRVSTNKHDVRISINVRTCNYVLILKNTDECVEIMYIRKHVKMYLVQSCLSVVQMREKF